MAKSFVEHIITKLEEAKTLYYRLLLVVGPCHSGKTAALQSLKEILSAPMINVNLELSYRLLDLTERQRALRLPRLLSQIVEAAIGNKAPETVLLDNIEILFDPSLKQDPLRLLQGLSRANSVVAAWNGTVRDNRITYAVPGHPEYRHYPIDGFLVVDVMLR